MRKLACGLLILAVLLAPAPAQPPDQAPRSSADKVPLLLSTNAPWPSIEAARMSQCDDSEWAQTIAEIKAADPELDADKQTAVGDQSLKSAWVVSASKSVRVVVDRSLGVMIVDGHVRWIGFAPATVQCKLPIQHVPAFPILHREVPTGTWCGRVALVLEGDYANRFNARVVGHQAYPHKDVCSVAPAGRSGQIVGKISDHPTPDMIPGQIPDIAMAARFGLTERVARFIADGAEIAQPDIFGFDALKWSVVRDYRVVFDLIVAAGGNPDFCAALKAAVEYKRVGPAVLLAQRCTSPEKRLELIESAVTLGSAGVVKPLIDTKPALLLTEANLRVTLHKAVSAGRVEIVRLLLDHASVELWEALRQDLMNTAARLQNTGMIGLLLERGADASPALRLAVQWKAHETVRALAGLGVDLNKALPVQPQKKRAADVQFDPLGRELPAADADPPIFMALHPLMDFKMVDLLLELGASPNVRDASGRTPLMIAITHSHIYGKKDGASWIERFVPPRLLPGQEDWEHRGVEAVRALLAKGADVTLADSGGLTALHHAARSDYNTENAHLLIAHGADVNARDKAGKTPLDHALDAGLVRMPDLLAKAGARRGAQ